MTFRFDANRAARARRGRRSARATAAVLAGAAGLTLAALAGTAAAQAPTTVATATNAALGESILVDAHGLTLYELRPETTRHLLCTKGNGCFAVWRPLTVASAKTKLKTVAGLNSKLGVLHRNGIFQVTLGGHPLYHFVGDGSRPGAATGQNIRSFGGTWHVVATSAATTTPVATPTTPTTTTPMPVPTPYPPGYGLGL